MVTASRRPLKTPAKFRRHYRSVQGERHQFCPLFSSALHDLSNTRTEYEGEFQYAGTVRQCMANFATMLDLFGRDKVSFEELDAAYLDCRALKGFPGWLITNLSDMINVATRPNGKVAAYVLNDLTHIGRLDPERLYAVVNLLFNEDNVHTTPNAGEP